jgi:hypothetical protein
VDLFTQVPKRQKTQLASESKQNSSLGHDCNPCPYGKKKKIKYSAQQDNKQFNRNKTKLIISFL